MRGVLLLGYRQVAVAGVEVHSSLPREGRGGGVSSPAFQNVSTTGVGAGGAFGVGAGSRSGHFGGPGGGAQQQYGFDGAGGGAGIGSRS